METAGSLTARVVQNPRRLSPPGCTKSASQAPLVPVVGSPANGCPLASLQGRGGRVRGVAAPGRDSWPCVGGSRGAPSQLH